MPDEIPLSQLANALVQLQHVGDDDAVTDLLAPLDPDTALAVASAAAQAVTGLTAKVVDAAIGGDPDGLDPELKQCFTGLSPEVQVLFARMAVKGHLAIQDAILGGQAAWVLIRSAPVEAKLRGA